MTGSPPASPGTPAPLSAWTVALLAALSLSGASLLRGFLHRLGALPQGWSGWVGAGILASLVVLVGGAFVLVLRWRRWTPRALAAAVLGLFGILVLVPAVAKTAGRLHSGSQAMVLDSVLQVEVAAGMLAAGRNPYRETYRGTELEAWHRGVDRTSLDHLVYPPLPMLLVLPFREVCLRAFGGFDSRFLLIPAVAVAFGLCWRAWRGDGGRPALLAIAFLNPLLLPNFHVGRWDTLVLLLWTLALAAWIRGRDSWMAAFLAMAALVKTTAAPAALFGAFLVARCRPEGLRRWIAVYAAVTGAVLLPFLAWDAPALIDDLFVWTAGLGPTPVPIVDAGPYGFAGIVLSLGWVSSPFDPFPFWVVQWPATAAVAAWGVAELRRRPSPWVFGAATTLTAGTYLYFNRFSDPAYFGALLSMAAVSAGFDRVAPASAPSLDAGGTTG